MGQKIIILGSSGKPQPIRTEFLTRRPIKVKGWRSGNFGRDQPSGGKMVGVQTSPAESH